jgi:hypothetical protein
LCSYFTSCLFIKPLLVLSGCSDKNPDPPQGVFLDQIGNLKVTTPHIYGGSSSGRTTFRQYYTLKGDSSVEYEVSYILQLMKPEKNFNNLKNIINIFNLKKTVFLLRF